MSEEQNTQWELQDAFTKNKVETYLWSTVGGYTEALFFLILHFASTSEKNEILDF